MANKNPEEVKLSGRTFKKAVAPCACCGLAPESTGDPDWDTYRAGLCDNDGVYFSYLCHHPSGGGCLDDIAEEVYNRRQADMDGADAEPGLPGEAELKQHKADALHEILADDEDGIWSEMAD